MPAPFTPFCEEIITCGAGAVQKLRSSEALSAAINSTPEPEPGTRTRNPNPEPEPGTRNPELNLRNRWNPWNRWNRWNPWN
jgi:hypothetical protein